MIEFIKHRISNTAEVTHEIRFFGFTVYRSVVYWNGALTVKDGKFSKPNVQQD